MLGAASLAPFGLFASQRYLAFIVALVIGFFIFGSMAGLYALAPILYPATIPTTGMGWAIGIGRIGAILARTIIGFLTGGGWKTSDLYYALAIPLVIGMLTVLALRQV